MEDDNDNDDRIINLPRRLMRSKEHLQTADAAKQLVSSISLLLLRTSTGGDSDGSSSSSTTSSSPTNIDIVATLKDFLSMLPRDNKRKSLDYLQIFGYCKVPLALTRLLHSPNKTNKEIAEESIRLFLINPNTTISFLPRSIHYQCIPIILTFCTYTRGIAGHENLYYSCRETLGSLVNSIGVARKLKYLDYDDVSGLIEDLYPFVSELMIELREGLLLIKESSFSTLSSCFKLKFESDIREFALFSLHLRRAIEVYVKSKGQSLPLSVDDNFHKQPRYLVYVQLFYHHFFMLLSTILCGLHYMWRSIEKANDLGESKPVESGSYYLSILKELNNISKLYQGAEEKVSWILLLRRNCLDALVIDSKRSGDHRWLLEHENVINYESKRHLMTVMLFPQLKADNEKVHKMVIDRSQLLTESFEQICLANPESLRNGLSVEFKNEVATGYGVLREWLHLVCQALFDPQNSLFLACPSDRRRFFPNPAKLDPHRLNYFRFCGRLIAFALMHKMQVGIAFDRVFFLQLAGEVISLEDVQYADPCLYNSCKKILETDANFMDSDAMGLTFVTEIEEFGSRKVVELCPKGNNMVVNSTNREEYIHLLIQHRFVKSISEKVTYFAQGFGDILSKRRLLKIFFQSLDLKDLNHMLLGSDRAICIKDWKANTEYNGYTETDEQILWFWKVVDGMHIEQQRELLFFWTSVKYLPVNGFSGLPSRLYIYRTSGSHSHLPSAHTCFYRLALPHYPSLAITQQNLFRICQEHVGRSFGL